MKRKRKPNQSKLTFMNKQEYESSSQFIKYESEKYNSEKIEDLTKIIENTRE